MNAEEFAETMYHLKMQSDKMGYGRADAHRQSMRSPLYGPQPCRKSTNLCLPDGECYACYAANGEDCRSRGEK